MHRIALVLGSGGFRGPAHIGVLQRLEQLRVPLYAMVGCSVGSLIAACYAGLGVTVEELLEYSTETGALAVVAHALSTWNFRTAPRMPKSWSEPVRRKLARLESCDFRSLHHGIRKIGFLMHDLKRAERVFAATGRERGLSVLEAVKASARLPGISPRLNKEIDGLNRRLVDGALSSPTPVLHAVCDPISATHVIAVELSSAGFRREKSQLDRWQERLEGRLLDRKILGESPNRRLWFARRMPDWYVRQVQMTDFRSTIDLTAGRSAFYRRRFAQAGIDPATIRCPADLGDLFTTSADLLSHPIEEFLCDRAHAGFETTGSSSPRRKRVCFSSEEMDEMGRDGAAGLWALGVRPGDRMVSTLDLPFWNAGPAIRTAARSLGCFLVETGMISPSDFYEQAADYRFTVLVAEPSWLVSLTQLAEKAGTWPVRLMLAGGENMTEKARRHVEEIWKADVFLTYGQTETFGGAGTECLRKDGYHLNELKFWFEIPEPDDDGYGELVITTLSRTVMPLVRYRTSDIARFLPRSCDCDFSGLRRISKIVGRCDEMVNCGLGHVSPWIFEQVLDGVTGISPDWQVVVTRPDLRDVIEVHLELLDPASQTDVETQVFLSLRNRFPEMARYLWMGLCELCIKPHPAGTLRAGRKLRAIVGRRGGPASVSAEGPFPAALR